MKALKTVLLVLIAAFAVEMRAQQTVDFSKLGPAVGAPAPAFSGPDQDGVTRSLASAAGPKGTMLVFFRSADW